MERLLLAFSVLLLTSPLRAQDDSSPDRDARLTTVEGAVYVHLHDHADGEFIAAEPDAPVEAGDLVRTGTDGHAELTLDGETVIDLSPNTDFVVESLAREQTEFHLGIGSIAAKIKSLLPGHSMRFRTNSAVAAVRGTELGVTQQSDASPAQVGVFDEGHVVVTKPDGGGEVHLAPGQETEVSKGKAPGAPRRLRVFEAQRQRMALLRQRQLFHRQNWKRFDVQERAQRRQLLRRRAVIRAEKLRGVRADLLRRRYAQGQAQKALQSQFQQLRREKQQDSIRQVQLERRRKEIQERRRKQAEEHRRELEERRRRQEEEKKRSEQRERVENERWKQAQVERQKQREERFRQAQERHKQKVAERQQEKSRKKQQRPNGN